MKAIVWTKYGSPDGLQLREVATPIPEDNEVLIKVRLYSDQEWLPASRAASRNFARCGCGCRAGLACLLSEWVAKPEQARASATVFT